MGIQTPELRKQISSYTLQWVSAIYCLYIFFSVFFSFTPNVVFGLRIFEQTPCFFETVNCFYRPTHSSNVKKNIYTPARIRTCDVCPCRRKRGLIQYVLVRSETVTSVKASIALCNIEHPIILIFAKCSLLCFFLF